MRHLCSRKEESQKSFTTPPNPVFPHTQCHCSQSINKAGVERGSAWGMLSSTLVAWPTSSSQRLIRPSPSLLSCLLGTLLSLSPLPLADSLTNFLFQYSCFPVCKALHRFSFPRLPQGPCSSKRTWGRKGVWREKEHSCGRMGSFQTLFSKSSPQHSAGWKALAGLRDSPTSSHLQKKPSHC